MITKYATGGRSKALIHAVEVEKETDLSVWIDGTRRAKVSDYKRYHDSWAEAKDHLMKKAEDEVLSLRNRLERAKSALGNVKGLKEPK